MTDPSSARMSVDALDRPAMAPGAVDADFTVREPADLVGFLHDMGERFVRSAASSRTPPETCAPT